MHANLDPFDAPATDESIEWPIAARRLPTHPITGLFDTATPVTTALISAIEPKLPPFRGD